MNNKINVTCVIAKEFNTGNLVVTTKATIEHKDSNKNYGKGYSNMTLVSKFPVSFETLQIIAAEKNMLSHLEDKGGIEFKDCPADFIYAKAQGEDRWYYAVVVELGTPSFPVKRTFYLNDKNERYLSIIGAKDQFKKVTEVINDLDESEDNE